MLIKKKRKPLRMESRTLNGSFLLPESRYNNSTRGTILSDMQLFQSESYKEL
jgi:hypothetical protein